MANNNLNTLSQQIQNLQQQYQSLIGNQQPVIIPNNGFQIPASQMPIPIQIPVQSHQVQYVEGIAGAKLYQDNLSANSSEIIMDKDDDIFYMVSKDANGTPSKRITRCRFVVEDIPEEESISLTRKDFDEFREEIRQLLASQNQNQKQVTLSSGVKKE